MEKIVVVLGASNSAAGKLDEIALDRLNACAELNLNENNLILCTGGIGPHFNTTHTPHAEYAKAYLKSLGIDQSRFLEIANSLHTVSDAIEVEKIIRNRECALQIITSNFHLERVKIIFDHVIPQIEKEYIGVEHQLPEWRSTELIAHEKKALAEINKNGLKL